MTPDQFSRVVKIRFPKQANAIIGRQRGYAVFSYSLVSVDGPLIDPGSDDRQQLPLALFKAPTAILRRGHIRQAHYIPTIRHFC